MTQGFDLEAPYVVAYWPTASKPVFVCPLADQAAWRTAVAPETNEEGLLTFETALAMPKSQSLMSPSLLMRTF